MPYGRAASEATEPLTLPAASGTGICRIAALSDDPLLLGALEGASAAGVELTSAPSTDRFADQLVARIPGIALIDAASVAAPLTPFLTGLRAQFPQLLLLLAGPAPLAAQVHGLIEDGTVFRFVHKPASSRRLQLFIDAAVRRLATGAAAPIMAPSPTALAAPAHAAWDDGVRRALASGIGAALITAALVWSVAQQYQAPPVVAMSVAR